MDFFYFLVTQHEKYGDAGDFHADYFGTVGFLYGFLGALVIGVICALIFYFGCCNNPKSVKTATPSIWAIFLIISGVIGYFYADFALIGDPDNSAPGTISFVEVNNQGCVDKKEGEVSTNIASINSAYETIKNDLKKGQDVAFEFDLTTAVLAMIFYFLCSLLVKRFTIAGKAIPMLKP